MRSRNKKKVQENLIEMKKATLEFSSGVGVFDLDFMLRSGSILGFIGPSGSGKTTAVRLLNGIYTPSSGEVCVFGKDPVHFSDADKSRIGYIPQNFLLYQNLSVEENLKFVSGMYGISPRQNQARMNELLEFFELDKARKRLGRKLSGGMQRRLMLAAGLMHDPQLIYADEPTAGIDPILRERIWKHFRSLRDQGRALLVTTQYVGEAVYCDLVAVLRRGRLIELDTPAALRRKAMGGDILQLQVERKCMFQVMEFLTTLPYVKKVEQGDGGKDKILVYMTNAGKESAALLGSLSENLGITPTFFEPYLPPFDEVFVRLVHNSEEL